MFLLKLAKTSLIANNEKIIEKDSYKSVLPF